MLKKIMEISRRGCKDNAVACILTLAKNEDCVREFVTQCHAP
jgi:hypothetical protein